MSQQHHYCPPFSRHDTRAERVVLQLQFLGVNVWMTILLVPIPLPRLLELTDPSRLTVAACILFDL